MVTNKTGGNNTPKKGEQGFQKAPKVKEGKKAPIAKPIKKVEKVAKPEQIIKSDKNLESGTVQLDNLLIHKKG